MPFIIDGKEVDLTNPQSWGGSLKILPGGSIQTAKNGVVTTVTDTYVATTTPQKPEQK